MHTQEADVTAMNALRIGWMLHLEGQPAGLYAARRRATGGKNEPVLHGGSENGHGRHEVRTIKVTSEIPGRDHPPKLPGAAQLMLIERYRAPAPPMAEHPPPAATVTPATTTRSPAPPPCWCKPPQAETVLAVTALTPAQACPQFLLARNRGHWGIEHGLHRAGETPRRSATLRPRRGYGEGLLGLEAAVEPLIGHGTWLDAGRLRGCCADVWPRWHHRRGDGVGGLRGGAGRAAGGRPAGSSGEEQILALAASIAAGVLVALGDLVCGLDEDNAVRVAIAVLHAAGFGGRSVRPPAGAGGDRQRARRVAAGGRGTGDGTGGPAGTSAARPGPAGLGPAVAARGRHGGPGIAGWQQEARPRGLDR